MEAEQKADSDTELESRDKKTDKLAIDPLKLDAQYEPIDGFQEWSGLSIETAIWTRHLDFLEARKATLDPSQLDHAIEVAMRAAAVDSGAIEGLYETTRGLTLTIALKQTAWEDSMRSNDERMHDYFEAQLAAYHLSEEIATSTRPVTEVWIRQLHEVLCRPQATYKVLTSQGWTESPLPKGEYKSSPNHVVQADGATHAYAPVESTPAEMHRLVEELNSSAFASAPPVLQAAFAHYAFVAIHPFADGNGRMARALASVFLRRHSYVPLLILADQQPEYFEALEAADQGDLQTFADFVFDRGIDAFALVTSELGPTPSELLKPLARLYESYGGLTFQELDQKAGGIINTVNMINDKVIANLPKYSGLNLGIRSEIVGNPHEVDDPAYRHPISGRAVCRVRLDSPPPATAQVVYQYEVVVAREVGARYAFRLVCSRPDVAALEVRLKDVHPQMSDSLTAQLDALANRALAEGLEDLADKAKTSLQQAGY